VEREPADVYVIACASDPGIDAVRAATNRPVLGVFRSAIAVCLARVECFGVLGIVDASRARHVAALRAMGVESRLAGYAALNTSMEVLLTAETSWPLLESAARELVRKGAQSVVLGCTGMAHHCSRLSAAVGVPVIEPCQAAVTLAIGIVQGSCR
jgi:Asp/Glu/hydantoin racemase